MRGPVDLATEEGKQVAFTTHSAAFVLAALAWVQRMLLKRYYQGGFYGE